MRNNDWRVTRCCKYSVRNLIIYKVFQTDWNQLRLPPNLFKNPHNFGWFAVFWLCKKKKIHDNMKENTWILNHKDSSVRENWVAHCTNKSKVFKAFADCSFGFIGNTEQADCTYRPPTDHLHVQTTYWPPTDHLLTTYWPPTDHLLSTYGPPTNNLPTTNWPPTNCFFAVQLMFNITGFISGACLGHTLCACRAHY